MYNPIISLSILLINIKLIASTYLNAESNYLKPKLERNNKINKGVWLKNSPKESFYEKSDLGDFIFRANSLDVDNVLQNNFDVFSEDDVQDAPFFTSYVERSKRSSDYKRKRNYRKSLINCKGKADCKIKRALHDKSSLLKSKFIPNLRPASVFNDYPYEVAILLSDINNKTEFSNNTKIEPQNKSHNNTNTPNNVKNISKIELIKENINSTPIHQGNIIKEIKNNLQSPIQNISDTKNFTTSPKRSTNDNYESEIIKKIEFTEKVNKTNENSDTDKYNRDIFEKFDKVWPQNTILPDTNVYNVVPKVENPKKSKPVTEGGLVKVLSMLTKTFKKIIKHHEDIKQTHNKMNEMNEQIGKDIEMMAKKFQDFDLKYLYIVDYIEKLKDFEGKLNIRDEVLTNKEKELTTKLVDFEIQQKKFLTQQHQFYNMQKLILAQNEKISLKQSTITKTQNEISHRQNNFAKILKKAKQLYLDNKHNAGKTKLANKPKQVTNKAYSENTIATSTNAPQTTESVKINLFSIPLLNRLENQDNLILKEKDYHSIDDLVYKYYFNNTFIDNLMKSNILASFMTSPVNTEISRNIKNVRTKNEDIKTTILLPVNQTDDRSKEDSRNTGFNRKRRWINHHSRRKLKRTTRGKAFSSTLISETDEKPIDSKKAFNRHLINKPVVKSATTEINIQKRDAFINMATNFCKEIGQNINGQILNWCIEKALRRLKNIDMKVPHPLPQTMKLKTTEASSVTNQVFTPSPVGVKEVIGADTFTTKSSRINSNTDDESSRNTVTPLVKLITEHTPTTFIYFPDNDELESNLKQFDMTPDTEGNYYYEGSLHASDIVTDSDGFSDILPGFDSNSHVDFDPITFDLQAKRRAYVRRMNANILKKISNGEIRS